MAKDQLTKRADEPVADAAQPATQDEDTEGQSLGLLLGLNALDQAHRADQRVRDRRYADEDLRRAREARAARAPKKV